MTISKNARIHNHKLENAQALNQCIVVGGGISKAGKWLFVPMRKAFKDRVIRVLKNVPIVPAQCGELAGLLGAGLLAQGIGD